DSWSGIGHVTVGIARQGYDLPTHPVRRERLARDLLHDQRRRRPDRLDLSGRPGPELDRGLDVPGAQSGQAMSDLDRIVRELVIANRILANEDVVDAYGHVSHRHPDDPGRYLLARSVSPELVERGDIVEFTLDGLPTGEETRALYLERFIHGAIYEARPDVMAVVHAHAEAVLPVTVTKTPLRPVIHSGGFMGGVAPRWDIAEQSGDL